MTNLGKDWSRVALSRFAISVKEFKLLQARVRLMASDGMEPTPIPAFTSRKDVRVASELIFASRAYSDRGSLQAAQSLPELVPEIANRFEQVGEVLGKYCRDGGEQSYVRQLRQGLRCAFTETLDEYDAGRQAIRDAGFSEAETDELIGACVGLQRACDDRASQARPLFVDGGQEDIGSVVTWSEYRSVRQQVRQDKGRLRLEAAILADRSRTTPYAEADGVTPRKRPRAANDDGHRSDTKFPVYSDRTATRAASPELGSSNADGHKWNSPAAGYPLSTLTGNEHGDRRRRETREAR